MKDEVIYNLKLIESATRMELSRKKDDNICDQNYIDHTYMYINVIHSFLNEMKESIKHLQ